jgi:hypothetical protein
VIIETIPLNSDLSVTLLDQTGHYFGGYFHVKLLAYCDVSLKPEHFENEAEYGDAVRAMGTTVRFERLLEKMAVPASEIESVRDQLTQAFRETTGAYLAVHDFASRFVRSEYQKRTSKSPRVRSIRA